MRCVAAVRRAVADVVVVVAPPQPVDGPALDLETKILWIEICFNLVSVKVRVFFTAKHT